MIIIQCREKDFECECGDPKHLRPQWVDTLFTDIEIARYKFPNNIYRKVNVIEEVSGVRT